MPRHQTRLHCYWFWFYQLTRTRSAKLLRWTHQMVKIRKENKIKNVKLQPYQALLMKIWWWGLLCMAFSFRLTLIRYFIHYFGLKRFLRLCIYECWPGTLNYASDVLDESQNISKGWQGIGRVFACGLHWPVWYCLVTLCFLRQTWKCFYFNNIN